MNERYAAAYGPPPDLGPPPPNEARVIPTGSIRNIAMCGPYQPPGEAEDECERLNEAYALGAIHSIDLSASPQNVPFEVALAYLKAGRKIKRATWKHESLAMQDGRIEQENGTVYIAFDRHDHPLLATDWCVIPEQP